MTPGILSGEEGAYRQNQTATKIIISYLYLFSIQVTRQGATCASVESMKNIATEY